MAGDEEEGWVKLHRKILDSDVADTPATAWVFVWCLLSAAFRDTAAAVGYRRVSLRRGQFVTTISMGTKKTGLTERIFRRCLAELERRQAIVTQKSRSHTLVTVVNFQRYQLCETGAGHAEVTQRSREGHTEGEKSPGGLSSQSCACAPAKLEVEEVIINNSLSLLRDENDAATGEQATGEKQPAGSAPEPSEKLIAAARDVLGLTPEWILSTWLGRGYPEQWILAVLADIGLRDDFRGTRHKVNYAEKILQRYKREGGPDDGTVVNARGSGKNHGGRGRKGGEAPVAGTGKFAAIDAKLFRKRSGCA